jgi:hypothetical protein
MLNLGKRLSQRFFNYTRQFPLQQHGAYVNNMRDRHDTYAAIKSFTCHHLSDVGIDFCKTEIVAERVRSFDINVAGGCKLNLSGMIDSVSCQGGAMAFPRMFSAAHDCQPKHFPSQLTGVTF